MHRELTQLDIFVKILYVLRPIYLIAGKQRKSFDCFYPKNLVKGQSLSEFDVTVPRVRIICEAALQCCLCDCQHLLWFPDLSNEIC